MFWRSRKRYPAASEMCSGRMSGRPSRSAIVRASFMIRVHARAERPMRSIRRSSRSLHSRSSGQYFSISLLFIAALQKIPSSAKRSRCISLAFMTLRATTSLDSAGRRSTSFFESIGCSQSCISIRSMIGPESFEK